MTNLKWISIALVALCLPSCIPHWEKPGATRAEFGEDKDNCLADAERRNRRTPRSVMPDYNDCMTKRGWVER